MLDKNKKIEKDEILQCEDLNISYAKISNLKGIELFYNLKRLQAINNNLSTVDLSQNKKLTKVTLKNNEKLKTVYLAEEASVATDISKKLIKRK